MRKLSLTLVSTNGPISFAVLGRQTLQIDGTGDYVLNHANFQAALDYVFEQVEFVKTTMSGKIVDGYDEQIFAKFSDV